MVLVRVPGERWEVEFLADGSVEVERFISDDKIFGEDILSELFKKYTDQDGEGSAQTWQEIRAARIRALRGKYRHMLTPSDEFARQKQEEIALGRDRQ